MKPRRRLVYFLTLIVALDFTFPSRAYAYIDPGTGSLFLQILLAALFAALFGLKVFWKRIINFVKSLFVGKSTDGGA